jgi:hypothetical protein
MRCIFCSAGGHPLTSPDAGEVPELNENPGVSRGYVAACHQVALPTNVEAPGIEHGTPHSQAQATALVTLIPRLPLAHSLARETQIDLDLARLMDAWPSLSPTVKRMILAALEASEPGN